MALLGKIRNQFGWVMMALVILGVGGFLFMDVSSVGRGGMGAQQRIVAKINGEEILREEFDVYVNNYANAQASAEEVRAQAWNDMLNDVIFRQQASKLGLNISEKELSDLFTGDDFSMSPLVRQQFSQGTGQVDRAMIEQQRNLFVSLQDEDPADITPEQYNFLDAWRALEQSVAAERVSAKYMGMVEKSMYAPGWMTKMEYARNNRSFDFNFVKILYADIPSSEVQVSDEELTAYIKENAKQYEKEASVAIEYIMFDVKPTSKDTLTYKTDMDSLAAEFATAENDTNFLQKYRGAMEAKFYTAETWLDLNIKDTLFQVEEGTVLGPYYDNTGSFKVVKVLETKNMPDSVQVRHIFKRANQRDIQSLQQNYMELDSLRNMLKADTANFDTLALKHSTDGTRDKGGKLGYRGRGDAYGVNFESYIFDIGKKDSFEIIQTQEGLHLIQITGYKYPAKANKAVRLGTLLKPIIPSSETEEAVEAEANNFMAANRTLEALQNAAKENPAIRRNNVGGLEINDFRIGQDANGSIAAEIIKWGHKDAKVGEVAVQVYPVMDAQSNYIAKIIVPALAAKTEKGVATIDDNSVKLEVERIVRNKKKAALVAKKLEGVSSLEAVVEKYSNAKVESAMGVRYDAPFIQELGAAEPKITAAADMLEAGKVSQPIEGNQGIYVIKLNAKREAPAIQDVKTARRAVMSKMIPRNPMNPNGYRDILRDAVKDKMKIKDNRSQIY